jgi:predicted enzyme related to lactoylglutathione lyase
MEVRAITWMGMRVSDVGAAGAFFEKLGLRPDHSEGELAAYTTVNGDTVEIFGPGDEDHRHFDTGPVVGFEVADVDDARRELETGGVEFVGPTSRGGGLVWAHFRGPDGTLLELTARE